MDIDHWLKLLGGLTSLLQVIIWPLLVVIAFVYLGGTVKSYLNDIRKDKNISEVKAEAGPTGIKFNIKRVVKASANLALAERNKEQSGPTDSELSENKTEEIVNIVSKAAAEQTIDQVQGTQALWVDDNPSNNFYERRSLEALGIQFTLSTSTEDALEKTAINHYDVIISDMGRPPDQHAGYTLLSKLRNRGIRTPFIIYAGSNRPEHKVETKRKGGFGTTNNPPELFQLVLDAIKQR